MTGDFRLYHDMRLQIAIESDATDIPAAVNKTREIMHLKPRRLCGLVP